MVQQTLSKRIIVRQRKWMHKANSAPRQKRYSGRILWHSNNVVSIGSHAHHCAIAIGFMVLNLIANSRDHAIHAIHLISFYLGQIGVILLQVMKAVIGPNNGWQIGVIMCKVSTNLQAHVFDECITTIWSTSQSCCSHSLEPAFRPQWNGAMVLDQTPATGTTRPDHCHSLQGLQQQQCPCQADCSSPAEPCPHPAELSSA